MLAATWRSWYHVSSEELYTKEVQSSSDYLYYCSVYFRNESRDNFSTRIHREICLIITGRVLYSVIQVNECNTSHWKELPPIPCLRQTSEILLWVRHIFLAVGLNFVLFPFLYYKEWLTKNIYDLSMSTLFVWSVSYIFCVTFRCFTLEASLRRTFT